jgi:hypothetical protein
MRLAPTLFLILPGLAFAADGIEIANANPYYWQYRGKPVLLLGGTSAVDRTFTDEGMFHRNDLTAELDKLTAAGGNYVRNLMSLGGRADTVAPFALAGERYDLDKWNEEYWRRFETFLRETAARGVITDVEMWATFDYYREGWARNPFNPKNNINYTVEQTGLAIEVKTHPSRAENTFFSTVPALNNQETVLRYQRRFVDRVLSQTLRYDHVLYCMDNETAVSPEWGAYWAKYIRSAAAKVGKKVQTTEMWDSHDLANPQHNATIDHPELYTYIEVAQNNHQQGQAHYDKLLGVRRRIASSPRPMTNIKIYGVDGGPSGTTQEAVERFWRNIFGGAASARFHEKHLGSSDTALRMIQRAREVTAAFDIFPTEPRPDLLSDREENEAYCLASPGKAYAVYFPGSGSVQLALEGQKTGFRLRWYAIDSGKWEAGRRVESGTITLRTPGSGQWAAILVANR